MLPPATTGSTHRAGIRTAGLLATSTLAGILTIVPAQAAQDRGELVATRDSRPDGSNLQYSTPQPRTDTASTGTVTTQARLIDDNAIEYLQVALGALGGVAIVGGLVAGRSVRHRGHTQPA